MHTKMDRMLADAGTAVLTVGEGRGFLVSVGYDTVVITAAHCLPHLPPPHPWSSTEERMYERLLGPVGEPPSVSAECLFVDPIEDVALLVEHVEHDDQVRSPEADAYTSLIRERCSVQIGAMTTAGPVWLLALNGEWLRCDATIRGFEHPLSVDGPPEAYAPGTSGSPVLDARGRAVALVSGGADLNPLLLDSLPLRILRDLWTRTGV
jgi:hypothetical protein